MPVYIEVKKLSVILQPRDTIALKNFVAIPHELFASSLYIIYIICVIPHIICVICFHLTNLFPCIYMFPNFPWYV